jgi:hypothetical protein
MDRVRALPDREIESFAREISPRSFERLDRLESEMATARAQLAAVNERTPSAGDLLDTDTALRLQDIERELSAPALTAKQRRALEDEREMIMASVDPNDRLPKQAERAQRKEQADLKKQIDKLEEQRSEALDKAQTATADLRRKLDRYAFAPGFEWAGRPDQPWTGPRIAEDMGFKEPAAFGEAMARAEVMRQARMVREIMPEGIGPNFKPDSAIPAPKAQEEITPEALKALDTEAKRLLEVPANAEREVSIDGRTMTAREALEDADRMARDASAALNCAVGAL